jgi:pimeloyl-ACP methyl ester carboxylesterase
VSAAPTDRLARALLFGYGFRSRYLPTSVGRVHLLAGHGKGKLPPIVLLHGIGASGMNYLPLLLKLRRHAGRIWVPEMPGHGFSPAPKAGASPRVLRKALREALDQLSEPFVLFGNSMGGAAAIEYASTNPERVRALIVASPGGAPLERLELTQFLRTFEIETMAEAREFVDRLTAKPVPGSTLMAWVSKRQSAKPSLRSLLSSIEPEDLLTSDHLGRLKMPVLCSWGQGDKLLPREGLEFFRAHLPGHAVIEEPEGLGHVPFLDDADQVAKRIVSFVRELPGVDRRKAGAAGYRGKERRKGRTG